MLLAIDTSSRFAGVALADDDGAVIDARVWRSRANHTAQLMPALSRILQDNKVTVVEIMAVSVALGPGPFSALRVGVSAAKGLAIAANLPIIGIDTLTLEAGPHWQPGIVVASWLEAGRNEVAAAWFNGPGSRIKADAITTPEELLSQDLSERPATLYCGEAAHIRRDAIRSFHAGSQAPASPRVVAPWTPADRLWQLAASAAEQVRAETFSDLSTLQPYYLRMPSIGAPKRRDRVVQGRPGSANR